MQEIVAVMASLDKNFAETGMYRRTLVQKACQQLGIPVDWEITRRSDHPRHGWYKFDMANLDMSDIRATAKARATVKQAPVEIAPVQEVVQEVKEIKRHDKKVAKNSSFGYVPSVDPEYIPFGCYKDIEKILTSRQFFPTYITGLSGNGKSTSVIQACAKNNIPLIRYSVSEDTDEEKLIGTKSLSEGNVIIEEGPILTAMRSGIPVLLEEIDAGRASSMMCLNSILEGKPYFFALTGEYITPARGFNIFATGNTKGKGSDDGRFVGTKIQNDAFLERFAVTFEQDYPSESIETKIILNWMESLNCVNEAFATDLAKWAAAIRKTFYAGGVDDLVATRRLQHIVRAYSIWGNTKKSIELCTGRFDDQTSRAFRDIFDKIATPEKVEVSEETVE